MQPLWKQRNYMLLWGGQGISWLGTEISGIAMPLIILALTGSPALAGAIGAILFALLPSFYIITGGIAREIPYHIQGRVTSITRSGDFISYSIGLFLVGSTLQFLGNAWTIIIFFLLLLIFTGATIGNKKLLSQNY